MFNREMLGLTSPYWRCDFLKKEGLVMALVLPSHSQQCSGRQHVFLHPAILCNTAFRLREVVYSWFHTPLCSGEFICFLETLLVAGCSSVSMIYVNLFNK